MSIGTARALVNAGFLTLDDLHTAHDFELATIPRVGPKSLAILYGLMGRKMSDAPRVSGKRQLVNRAPSHVEPGAGIPQVNVAPGRTSGVR